MVLRDVLSYDGAVQYVPLPLQQCGFGGQLLFTQTQLSIDMRIGVYSGSFNPVHVGHVALADYLVQQSVVDKVWLIRSPLNPLKHSEDLMSNEARADMLALAIQGHPGLEVCTVEDHLPLPNYTIRTLQTLQQQYPQHQFHLVIGADNWAIFNQWREWDVILRDFHLVVYPRPGYPMPESDDRYPTVRFVQAPMYDISSTQIRQRLKSGLDLTGWVDPKVAHYLKYDIA